MCRDNRCVHFPTALTRLEKACERLEVSERTRESQESGIRVRLDRVCVGHLGRALGKTLAQDDAAVREARPAPHLTTHVFQSAHPFGLRVRLCEGHWRLGLASICAELYL